MPCGNTKGLFFFFLILATLVRILCHFSFQEEKGEHREPFSEAAQKEGFWVKSQCPPIWSSVTDGSELSHKKASRPSAFCSLYKQAEAREAQVLGSEGSHELYLVTVAGCSLWPWEEKDKDRKARSQAYWKQDNEIDLVILLSTFQGTFDLDTKSKPYATKLWNNSKVLCWGTVWEENLWTVILYWIKNCPWQTPP